METVPSLLDETDVEDAAYNLADQIMSAIYPVILTTVTEFLEQFREGGGAEWDLVSESD